MLTVQTSNVRNIRTLSSYMSLLSLKSKSTQKLFQCTINNIEKFGGMDINVIYQYDEDDIYDILQDWIIWNTKRGITASSLMCYFNAFRSYLWYQKIKLDQRDIRHNLRFPQTLHESQTPITANEIAKILHVSDIEFRFQLLALISSGMRVGELGQIRIGHLDLTHSNIIASIPSHITKTGRSRITFFSRQISDMIRYRIERNKSIDFLFDGYRHPEQFLNLVLKRFASARRRAGLMEKHSHCKQTRYKIHVHSMRSYFITKANKIQFGLGHILAGHDFYMKEYNRYTVDELLSMYRQFEKDVTFQNPMNLKFDLIDDV